MISLVHSILSTLLVAFAGKGTIALEALQGRCLALQECFVTEMAFPALVTIAQQAIIAKVETLSPTQLAVRQGITVQRVPPWRELVPQVLTYPTLVSQRSQSASTVQQVIIVHCHT